MLYELNELQSATWSPFLPWIQATAGLLASPYNPLSGTPLTRQMAAGCELLVRLCQRYPKPEFGLTETVINGKPIGVAERVVLDKPFCRLLHFERAIGRRDPVVLVVAPLSGHHATLLRDTVRAMLPDFNVYITDWRDARSVPRSKGEFHLDDYVNYVRECIDFLGPEVHVVSVCQSTAPVLAAISLMASDGEPTPRSMTLMGGPIDARRSPTRVNELAVGNPLAWFARNLIHTVPGNYPGAGRQVYPGFLQLASFVAMNPDRHLKSHLNYYGDMSAGNVEAAEAHRRFYDEYNAVLDMTAEYYLETVQTVFQEFCLPRGVWRVHGQNVRPQDIEFTTLITVEGEADDICGVGQTMAAHELCESIAVERKHHLSVPGCGHYGIFSGRRWRSDIYPRIRDLIRQCDAADGLLAEAA
ncbi:esterase [Pandoraea terrae]|uniref:Esterase n=1 Tax=Pandoraea terrae TaxID=1537710 RepID=A0A5E4U9E2_9BURK|nr:polyhydroxyalkanoate depolymerase [Pandoraea terrae]VVD96391.1 esterase [Pandoraea terrae]